MKDFKTKKSEKLLEEVQVDGQDIYMNLAAVNMLNAGKLAERFDDDRIGITLELAEMLFIKESYALVQFMDLEDLADLLDIATKVLNEQENTLTERFKRPE
jgi:chaperonin cofactor prefoldin